MLKSAAYVRLGYQLRNFRWSWSAESEHGVCIDLWRAEVEWAEDFAWFDSRVHGNPIVEWGDKPGNKHRKPHLLRARDEFHGIVDVVILEGDFRSGVRNAVPWLSDEHAGQRWVVTEFEEGSGHCSIVFAGRPDHGDN